MSNSHGVKGFAVWTKLAFGLSLLMLGLNLHAATIAPLDGFSASSPAASALCFKKLNFGRIEPRLQLVAQVPFETESNCADIEHYRGFSERSGQARRQNVDPDFGMCRFMAQDADREYPPGLSGTGEMLIQEPVPSRPVESLTF